MTTVFKCVNPACSLGSRKSPGTFTGGMTKAGQSVISGMPEEQMVEGEHYGVGVCPNCGEAGEPAGHEHEVQTDHHDPFQPIHDEIAAKVADEDDPLTADEAQDVLIAAVAAAEEEAPSEDEE